MAVPKVYADFQNLDDHNRLRLTCAGTQADLAHQGVELHEGLRLTLYMDDADDQGQPDELLAEGVVHYNEQEHTWVASIDWSAIRHASDDAKQSANGANTDGGTRVSTDGLPGKPS